MSQFPWWEAQRAHVTSRPSGAGLQAMAEAVSRGSTVVRYRRLVGGIMTATSVVCLRTAQRTEFDVVLKRFRDPDDSGCINEWKRLLFARSIDVPSPEPLARDEGEWFGAPALVMTRLPGRPDVEPDDVEGWLGEIARTQVAIKGSPQRSHRLEQCKRSPARTRSCLHARGHSGPRRPPDGGLVPASLRARARRTRTASRERH